MANIASGIHLCHCKCQEIYLYTNALFPIRTTIKSLPEQDFSPNIEKYHLVDVVLIVVFIITLAIVSVTYYLAREINWVIIVTYAIHEATVIATTFFFLSHITSPITFKIRSAPV